MVKVFENTAAAQASPFTIFIVIPNEAKWNEESFLLSFPVKQFFAALRVLCFFIFSLL